MNMQERRFAATFAATGDGPYSAAKAGYSSPAPRASQNLAKPAIQAEIARIQQARLFEEALPLAVRTICSILENDKAPAGARVQAAKVVFDRTLGLDEAGKAKDPHEMTPDEIARSIAELKRIAADRARPIIDGEKVNEPDIFE